MEQCPVCEMKLQPGQEEASWTYQDTTYHFCSQECCKMFQGNPKQYVQETASTSA